MSAPDYFGYRYIRPAYFKRFGFETKRAREWTEFVVHIRTNSGLWREDAAGYTNYEEEAGIYEFWDAWEHIKDLGPEKMASLVSVNHYGEKFFKMVETEASDGIQYAMKDEPCAYKRAVFRAGWEAAMNYMEKK